MTGWKLLTAAALTVIAAVTTPAVAADSHWMLSGVTFDDGGTASGFFTYDPILQQIDSLLIITAPGANEAGSYYSDAVSSIGSTSNMIDITNNELGALTGYSFYLVFANDLTPGNTIPIQSGDEQYAYVASFYPASFSVDRLVTAGSVVSTDPASPVPEPGAWAMALAGFGTIGFMLRRQARTTSAKIGNARPILS